MTTQTLLSDDPATEPQIDPNKNYLEELVGEGKKFKTPEELAKGKYHSDAMIEIQNRRLDEMRNDYLALKADYDARAKLEEIMDQFKTSSQRPSNEHTEVKTEPKQPLYDPKEVETLVSKQLREYAVNKTQEDNFNIVRKTLTERFGNNYKSVLKSQAIELDLSDEAVDALARRSPKAFFKTFGLDQQQQTETFQTPPSSSVRSDSFKPNTKKRTWSYYQELKKSNPNAYRDPKTATQMIKDYEELGTAFEDGDFGRL